MTYNSIKNISFSASIAFHLLLLLLFLLIKVSITLGESDYVTLSYGTTGGPGSSGGSGSLLEDIEPSPNKEEQSQTLDKSAEVKEVDLPKAVNNEKENVIKQADKDKDVSEKASTEAKDNTESKYKSEGQGNKGAGKSGYGYDIDWGGKGQRKIYSWILPEYPEGVSKEIDIRLKFTILPDGTVGNIIPLIKADTKLENAAINSLRQWRFEALNPAQKQLEQIAVIVFPYRLQ
jgi:protein TonB